MQGSLNSSMGEHLVANNKLAYSGHQTPPITPDGLPSGAPAAREALSDLQLCDLRVLRGSIFNTCNPCVLRSGIGTKKYHFRILWVSVVNQYREDRLKKNSPI